MTRRRLPPRPMPPARPPARRLSQLPVTLVLLVLLAGLATVTLHQFRVGCYVLAVAMLGAAGFRLVLPARRAGLLVVRSRPLDIAVLLAVGFAVLVLAKVVPAE